MAGEIESWPEATDDWRWCARFNYQVIERRGTGGANFRRMYARFLEEAYQELIRVVEIYRGLLDTSNPIGWMERQERVREAEAGIDFDYLQKEIPSAVEQTLEGIERVSTIVRAMKTFSHQGHKEQVPADLNDTEADVTVRAYDAFGGFGSLTTRVRVDTVAPQFSMVRGVDDSITMPGGGGTGGAARGGCPRPGWPAARSG